MKRKHLAQLGFALTAFSGFAVAGSNCIGDVEESNDAPAGTEQPVKAPEEATEEAEQALPTPVCITLKRGVVGAVADTQVATAGGRETKNYGAGLAMIAGQVNPGQRRSLIRVDMAAVPANLGIVSATLTLQARSDSQGGVGNQLSVHAVTSPWNEATVTWNTQPTFDAAVVASDPGGPGTHTFDVTTLAQGWAGGANNGVLLEQNAFYYTNFDTSEDAVAANRPGLSVCYVPNVCAGVTCGASDQCHTAGTCDPNTGACSNPNASNGTACNDGNAGTTGDVCTNGTCAGTAAGFSTCSPNPGLATAGACGQAGSKCLFQTSCFYSAGQIGGLAGADAICQGHADAAALGGTFKAWLSTAGASAASRMTQNSVPYRNVNGGQIVPNWTSFVNDTTLSAPGSGGELNRMENGVVSGALVWTNTQFNGSTLGNDCAGWTSDVAGTSTAGHSDYVDASRWTVYTGQSCSKLGRLYCLEQ